MNFRGTKLSLMMALILTIMIVCSNAKIADKIIPTATQAAAEKRELEKKRPKNIKFPESFQIGISTNDPGLNVTELIYYDAKAQKIRLQVFYSLLGLEANKALDLVLDEGSKMIAIQGEGQGDCKYTSFHESLAPIGLFFSMFTSLTDYKGLDSNGLHAFQFKQFTPDAAHDTKFIFLFDKDNIFTKARIESKEYEMIYDFETVTPMEGQEFGESDWQQKDCAPIDASILTEGNHFATFMYQFALHLIGTEEEILAHLGLTTEKVDQIKPFLRKGKMKYGQDEDDEAFDEEEEEEIIQ